MKRLSLIMFLILSSSLMFAQKADKEAIKEVIQTAYVEGLQNEGDAKKIDSGIHPDFNLLGINKDGSMWKLPINDWKAKAVKKRKDGVFPLKGKDKVSVKFKEIDITGNAAMVKLEYYKGKKLTFIDYISLYKFGEGWKMVSKIFHRI